MSRLRPSPEAAVLAGLALLLAVIVLTNNWGVLTPDTKPEFFLNPWQSAKDFARPWLASPELGSPSFNVGVAPVAAIFAAAKALGLPAWLIQRVWRIALLLIAGWAARALYRELTHGTAADTAPGRVAAAVAFAANPYVIVGGGTTPTLLPYALLPAFVLGVLRAVRLRSWRWSVLAALALAATSGLNAGVVTLLQLVIVIPVAVHVGVTQPRSLGRLVVVLIQSGAAYLALSLYWLVPSIAGLARGSSVVASTERLDSINIGSSFAEVLRGLGMWSLYGAGPGGPFLPRQLAFLSSAVVVVLTFGGPVLAALGARLSRSPARVFAAASVLTGALVMAAPFPYADRSAWGDAVVRALEGVPGAGAFRTLNKAGAVLEIGVAVLVGLAVAILAPRLRESWQRVLAVGGAAALVMAGTAPAWTGGLFPVTMDLPGYWQDAAQDVNDLGATSAPGRVLLTPGIKLAAYDWGYAGPDELGNSLFRQPNVFRTTTPSSSPEAADLLAEVDRRAYLGILPPGTTSALARLIQVGVVVSRYDTALAPGADKTVEAQLAADPGLLPAAAFGPPHGEGIGAVNVRPVQAAGVQRTLLPAKGALLIDGSGSVLPQLVAARLLTGWPTMVLAGSQTPEQTEQAVRDGAHVILSDSNGRRQWSDDPTRTGWLLGPTEGEGATRALYTEVDQTVARADGNATITTSGPGQLFGPFATGDPYLAFDGDPSTQWFFGNFGAGVGNALTVTLPDPIPIGVITLRTRDNGGVRVAAVRITGAGPGGPVVREAKVSAWQSFATTVDLGGAPLRSITIEVTETAGDGQGWVGIGEISIPGVSVRKVARLPQGLPERLSRLDPAVLGQTPIDVLLRRRGGDPSGLTEEEPRLERDVQVPDTRPYDLTGTVRLASGAMDRDIDLLLGASSAVQARASSRAFGKPVLRGSMVLDGSTDGGDLATGWIPADPVAGESLRLDFPKQRLGRLTIDQNTEGAIATSALVSVNDGTPVEVALSPGHSTIQFPAVVPDATRVRILLTGRMGDGPVRILNVGGLPRMTWSGPGERCVPIATIDGQPWSARLLGSWDNLLSGGAVAFTSCDGDPQELSAGGHALRSVSAFAVDEMQWHGRSPRTALPPTPSVRIEHTGPTSVVARLDSDCAPCYFSSGQGRNTQWRATLNGADLGVPVAVDGYASGWRIDGRAGDVVIARFGPARATAWAWGISLSSLVLALIALTWPRLARWRRRDGVPAAAELPELAVEEAAAPSDAPARGWVGVLAWTLGVGLAVAATVGPLPGLVAALVVIGTVGLPKGPSVTIRWRPFPSLALTVACVLSGLIPLAWYAGPSRHSALLDEHIGANWVAQQTAGLAIWLLAVGVILDHRRRTADESRP
ncbi:alpha-(1-_3)-arabinofuranosyltransferase domain-containing protein [Nostocoides jenkinsii]|uniref:Putative membrane protein n=1 Tax=Nostocoides jenkinsii Ben 74 TaxID=1193518 RepID=A0A077MCV3_9MICO|nr:alpha-(1->3)-arabinofuranosyltransferase family protein [Tetrasphaera jenkinsii]CCI52603.1 putative membrane protein [Tetrasphaera jenkinsii Ben 74]